MLARITKRADRIAAFLEATRLAGFAREEAVRFFGPPKPLPRAIEDGLVSWDADKAKARFLDRFAALSAEN